MNAELAAEIAAPYTMTSPAARLAMARACERIEEQGVTGDIVECGVWLGGNIVIARLMSPRRTCWLYDTFTGMTRPEPIDVSRKGKSAMEGYDRRQIAGTGWCLAPLDTVKASLAEAHVFDEDRLRFVEGDVCETLLVPENLPERISVLRLDTDWYQSTKLELEVLWPRLSKGGVLVVDDWGHWRGARKAFDEYFGRHKPPFEKLDYTAIMVTK